MNERQPKDLEEMLVKSIETLRASPSERRKYPSLDRLLSRIDAHERRVPSLRLSGRRWLRPLIAPLSSAAAGFAGAALALLLLPNSWFTGAPSNHESAGAPVAVTAPAPVAHNPDAARILSRSIHRLERAIHGLEKFQPVVESRIEWIEDALQRKHADAYASLEGMSPSSQTPYTPVARKDSGV